MLSRESLTEFQTRLEEARKLLAGEATDLEKFESVRVLVKGLDARLDRALEICSKALSDFAPLKAGEVIDLSAEHLSEDTEEKKRRKKYLLLFIKSWKDLRSEVERVGLELSQSQPSQTALENVSHLAKIVSLAKGPLGVLTLAALGIVSVSLLLKHPAASGPQSQREIASPSPRKTKIIVFGEREIVLSSLYIGSGSDCNEPHYHALDHKAALALDGGYISDPGGCGFGRVSQTPVQEVTTDPRQ